MFIAFAIPTQAFSVKTPAQIEDYIIYKAQHEGVDVTTALSIAKCESGFHSEAVGDHGQSFGVFQIHLPAHSEITREQALNPIWAVNWSIDQMALGRFDMWSCFLLSKGTRDFKVQPLAILQ